jgi:hypothetical protein
LTPTPTPELVLPNTANRALPGPFEDFLLGMGVDPILLELSFEGADRGTNQAADVITETLDGADLNAMWREFQTTVNIWNRDRNALVNVLTFGVTNPVERVRYPVEEDFEEATEFGEPKGIRLGPSFNMGYDFKWYDLAIRYTWLFLAESTQAQLRALNNSALEADNRLMFTKILRAIFNNVNRSATINEQAVNVYPFYNNDGTTPPSYHGNTFASSHNHYLVSGGATVDSGDLDALETHLTEHGYNINSGYKLVLMVNRAQGTVIRQFRVSDGDKYDFIPSAGYGGGVILQQGQIIARPTGGVSGLLEIGTYGPWIIVEDDYVPAGYMLGIATGGERNLTNPVGIREHENANLRGLQLVKGREPDYPLIDSFYRHGFGTGIRHRGGGVVMQVKASGTYDIPAAYV